MHIRVACLVCVAVALTLAVAPRPALAARPPPAEAAPVDPALALSIADDLAFSSPTDPAPRAERVLQFEALVAQKLGALPPLDEASAARHFGTLVALRREAGRTNATVTSELNATRRADLEPVVAAHIAPHILEVAPLMWKQVEAAAARGEHAAAVVLGVSILAELPPGTPYAARVDEIAREAGERHLALARAAGDTNWGARTLHARLAELYGVPSGGLAARPPELEPLTGWSWASVTSDGACGEAPVDGGYDIGTAPLAKLLRDEHGFLPGPGVQLDLDVVFDSCPVTLREWETEAETEPYSEMAMVEQEVIKTRYGDCYSSTTTAPSSSTTVSGQYYDVTYTTPGETTTTNVSCTKETYTDIERVERLVERVENYGVSHRVHTMKATGTIRIRYEGGTQSLPFSLEAVSDDDVAFNPMHGGNRHGFHNLSEAQARDRMKEKVLAKIYEGARLVSAARAAVFVAEAQARAGEGRAPEAEHAYFVASQVSSLPPAFAQWMERQYRVSADVLGAAIAARPAPRTDLAAAYAITLPAPPPRDHSPQYAKAAYDLRRILMVSYTAGPTQVRHAGGTLWGGLLAVRLNGVFSVKNGFAMGMGSRLAGGFDGTGHFLVDGDLYVSGGLVLGGFHLAPLVGIGGDGIPRRDEGEALLFDAMEEASSVAPFDLPGAATFEYGARIAYVFPAPRLGLEAIYSHALRTSLAMPRETRLDARILLGVGKNTFALTGRYMEYGSEATPFFTSFGPDGRAAQSVWVLGGVGL